MDRRKKYEDKMTLDGKKMFAARVDRAVMEKIKQIARERKMPIAALTETIFRDYVAITER